MEREFVEKIVDVFGVEISVLDGAEKSKADEERLERLTF